MPIPRRQVVGVLTVLATGWLALACGQAITPSPTPTLQSAQPTPTATEAREADASALATPTPTPAEDAQDIAARFTSVFASYTWATDFSNLSVPIDEIQFLGLPRVDIRSSEDPPHESIEEAAARLIALEPVIVVEVNGKARAYPQSMLISVPNEVVNDTLGGVPIAVTW